MRKTQRVSEPVPCSVPLIFLRIGFFLLLFSGPISRSTAQQVGPDSTRKTRPDTTTRPAPKTDPAPAKPATDTLPKPQNTTDSASKSSSSPLVKPTQNFDPLIKPAPQKDSLNNTGNATGNSAAGQPAKPDSTTATPAQTGNANAAQPAQNAAQTADSAAAQKPAPGGTTDAGPDARTIKGVVRDEKGAGMPGVAVLVKGTQIQAITEPDGSFQMKVPAKGGILVYSFVGFTTKEVPITGMTNYDTQLVPEAKALKEVVVVGYGAQSKRDLASSTSRVAAQEYKSAVINTIDQAIQGRATGVQVVESSGEPGAAAVVRIRGNNSLSGNNEPLYVIDGFPMPPYREAGTNFYGSYTQNGLYGINPNDIESMEILKDASATAIYGSRGPTG